MSPDQHERAGTRTLVVGVGVLLLAGIGWFALSHVVMGTATSDAVGEALGVVLALAVVASIAGAFVSARGNHR
jgi:hypothetical protein